MTSAAHVTMTVHPVFLLLLLLSCSCAHVSGSIRIVKNQTVNSSDDCDATKLCGPEENCTHTLLNREQTRCYVLSCSEHSNNSCEEATRVEELLQEQDSASKDHTHTPLLQSSSGNHSLLNATSSSPVANVSSLTSTLHPTPTSTTSTLHPTPTNTSSTLHPTPTNTSSTLHPTPTNTSSTLHPTPTNTSSTLHPTPTNTSSTLHHTPTISTSQMSSTTAAEAKPTTTSTPSPSPHTTTPSSTTAKASTRPSEVSTTPTESVPTTVDHSRSDTAVAGDLLTSHLLNTSSLLAVLLFGLLFLVVTLALFLKQAYESFKRKDYTQVDYLINGMYSDSGV